MNIKNLQIHDFDVLTIIHAINADGRFAEVKANPLTIAAWESPEIIILKKDIGRKGMGRVSIRCMDSTKDGLEFIIQIYLASGGEYETFFEGFIESEDDLKVIFKSIGL